MKVRTEATRCSFRVSVTLRQFTRIEAKDERATGMTDFGLMTLLEKQGAMDIEYNGHFGAAIYYTLDAEDATRQKLAELEKLIIEYAEGK